MSDLQFTSNTSFGHRAELIVAAKELFDLEYGVLPLCYNKKPPRGFKGEVLQRAKSRKMAWDELALWFDNPGVDCIGIVPSGNVVCVDFDRLELFEQFCKRHPELVKQAPYYLTNRGAHIWLNTKRALKSSKKIGDVDVIAGGKKYAMVPPSLNNDGNQREWLNTILPAPNELPTMSNLIKEIRALAEPEEGEEREEAGIQKDKRTDCNLSSVPSVPLFSNADGCDPWEQARLRNSQIDSDTWLQRAIEATVPAHTGMRNRQVFHFARYLKSHSFFAELFAQDPFALKACVEKWLKAAGRAIGTPDPLQVTLDDFLAAWNQANIPVGNDPRPEAIAAARETTDVAGTELLAPSTRLIARIMQQLDLRSADGVIFFPCNSLEEEPEGYTRKTVNTALHALESTGFLQLVSRGKQGGNTATKFLWIGPQTD